MENNPNDKHQEKDTSWLSRLTERSVATKEETQRNKQVEELVQARQQQSHLEQLAAQEKKEAKDSTTPPRT